MDIRQAEIQKDIGDLQDILQKSNKTVADEFNFTKENAPTNPAYITEQRLSESFDAGIEFYVCSIHNKKVGCIAIEEDKDNENNYFIERLAVLPEYRHNKIGTALLDYAVNIIRTKNGRTAGIAIINENEVLKNWYISYGFVENTIKKFNHLPFTVCFLNLTIAF